jgi:hypothetical protein
LISFGSKGATVMAWTAPDPALLNNSSVAFMAHDFALVVACQYCAAEAGARANLS